MPYRTLARETECPRHFRVCINVKNVRPQNQTKVNKGSWSSRNHREVSCLQFGPTDFPLHFSDSRNLGRGQKGSSDLIAEVTAYPTLFVSACEKRSNTKKNHYDKD